MTVASKGPAQADILLLDDSPLKLELKRGIGFESRSWGAYDQILLQAGINPNQVHFAHLHPRESRGNVLSGEFSKDAIPSDLFVQSLEETRALIESVDPVVIVPVGNFALWATTHGTTKWNKKKVKGQTVGFTGLGDWRGSIIEGRKLALGRKVVPTYGASHVQGKYSDRVFVNLDWQRIKQQAKSKTIARPNYRIDIAPNADLDEWEKRLMASEIIFFDIEYIGTRLLCVSFCVDSEQTLVVPTSDKHLLEWVRRILTSGHDLGAQNGLFDCSILEWHYGMEIMPFLKYDTMLAAHASYPELPKDLGTLCSIYTEQPCYWTHINWKDIKEGRQPISDVYEYNGIDSWVTHEVAKAQRADELLDPLVKKTFQFEMDLVVPLWDMSRRGIRFDEQRREQLRRDCEMAVAEGNRKLAVLADLEPDEINVKGGVIREILFDYFGLRPTKITKGGKASTDDKALAELSLAATQPEQKAAISLVRLIRKNRSLVEKFCSIQLDHDSRFRCHYNPGGTNTGRLASKKFYPTGTGANGQNIPRDKRARMCFVPDPGMSFFYNDLERAESMVVAYLSGDPLMLAHHKPGVDAHVKLAALLFDCTEEEAAEFTKRYLGKQTRHAGNYMEGWKTFMSNVNKLAEETGVALTASESKHFIGKYRSLHSHLESWWRQTQYIASTEGRLISLLGRPRQFYDRHSESLPNMVAFVPQSTVGDALNIGLVRCYHDEELRSLGCQQLLQVHDAIGGQAPTENIPAVMRRARELMSVELTVPKQYNCPTSGESFSIPVELGVSVDSWGTVSRYVES